MEIKDSDIVIFSLLRHDLPFSSTPYSLAKEFAKNNRVFYIDHPHSLKDIAQELNPFKKQKKINTAFFKTTYKVVEGHSDNLIVVKMPFTLPVNFLPAGAFYNVLAKVNDMMFFKAIRHIIADFKIRKFIYINSFDPYFGLNFPSDINPVVTVYQSVDDLSQVSYNAKHGVRLEREFMKLYDHTLVTSRQLFRLHEKFAKRIHYHPNAVDSKLFEISRQRDVDMPVDLGPIKQPILTYTGAIDYRIDYTLLGKLVDAHPDKSLVLIGPITDNEVEESNLKSKDNVYFLGPKKIEELPAYLKFSDCLLIPFKCNTLTSSIYPLKVNEYLASGKPTIVTNFSDDIRSFGDVLYVSADIDDFVAKIGLAIDENSDVKEEKRVQISKENSWEMRVKQFWQMVKVTR